MQTAQYTIEAEQHSMWEKVFSIVGLPDLTGAEAKLEIKTTRNATTALVELTEASGISFTTNTMTITLTSTQVDAIGCSGVYDVFIKPAGEDWFKLFAGRVVVNPSVTDPTV